MKYLLTVTLAALGLACYTLETGTTHKINIKNMKYEPKIIEIQKGDTVEWTNKDGYPHTVTSGRPGKADGKFDSKMMRMNDSFSHTFDEAGEFPYYCVPHAAMMQGKVIVK